MKSFLTLILLALALLSLGTTQGNACWSMTDECGTTPTCVAPNPPAGAYAEICTRYFCDEFVQCSWRHALTRMREFQNIKYTWQVGSDVHLCVVLDNTEVPHPNECCSCENPGTVVSKP